ncbi:flagellar hook-length control protein FliK [Nocardioides sp. AE5]|uniref:flagellar hook-length control protein FliK n=1 Tax=Nocardioides sp. AE5 TaxID=2962573 RepID=UPI0028812C14|nr:flagellar hook-length control protein FliK [Nocardioides sp. AE5]MDT0200797.1 flagellar hook-length control protein FliK [Nocardioides sp. AE5]
MAAPVVPAAGAALADGRGVAAPVVPAAGAALADGRGVAAPVATTTSSASTAPAAPGDQQVTATQQVTQAQPVTATQATTLGQPTPGATAAPVAPATAQVAEQITQLVTSAGSANGTHRVTLKLQPEQLGDVRVVLTVRDGAMHVQLAAHDTAARTLLEDAPELRRLLDQLGAADSRVSVREMGTTAQGQDGAWTGDRDQAAGSGGQHQMEHDRARTPGHHTATDGTTDAAPGLQHTRQATPHPGAGLDLTM